MGVDPTVSQREIWSATQRSKGTGGLDSIVSYSRPSLMIIASRTQFHVERPCRGVNARLAQCLNSVLNVKAVVASRRFQPGDSGEGPSRGFLRDCTTSPINLFAALEEAMALVM